MIYSAIPANPYPKLLLAAVRGTVKESRGNGLYTIVVLENRYRVGLVNRFRSVVALAETILGVVSLGLSRRSFPR